jgi:hypothetical protein
MITVILASRGAIGLLSRLNQFVNDLILSTDTLVGRVRARSPSTWRPSGPLHSTWTVKVAPSRFRLRMVQRPNTESMSHDSRRNDKKRRALLGLKLQEVAEQPRPSH